MATKKPTNTKAAAQKTPLTAKIDRMIDRENATVKAYASVNLGGEFVIRDIAVVDGQKGLFARMPFRSYKSSDGETKYSDIVFAITDSARHSIEDAVIGAYRNQRTKVLRKVCSFFGGNKNFSGLSVKNLYCIG